jgi:transketolase
MGAISQTNVNFVGSHCGISIGEDGPSQMGLEDIAMFRAIPDSTIFYPSDAVSTERAVEIAAKTKGICFIRTSRPPTAVLYSNDESFKIGEAKIIRSFPNDRILVIAAGVTLHEALSAADELDKIGINIRVMDLFTVKPLDVNMIVRNAREVGGKIITVEDHYPQGGIGETVVSAIANQKNVTVVKRMAVSGMPRSGSSALLLDNYGISARNIIATVHEILDI